MTKTGDHRPKDELPTISETRPLSSMEQNVACSKTDDADGDDDIGDQHDEDTELGSSPLWSGANEGWELTWPIWHFLQRDERKKIAQQHGYKSIGEFEEFMSLQRAVDDSGLKGVAAGMEPIKASVALATIQMEKSQNSDNPKEEHFDEVDDKKNPATKVMDDEDEEYLSDDDEKIASGVGRQASESPDECCLNDLVSLGGKILMLHDEILHQVFAWLPVDTYGTMALVSPHWKHITRTEAVYKRLCERLYLNQSKRRQLHVSRFGGSYRTMLEERPRVRAAGGCYVLKYSQVKKIQRDMWTEVPLGAILETVYYRYLYFQEDGRVLYALSSAEPHEMFRRLLKVILNKADDPAAVWGTFQIQKHNCTIVAKQEWHAVKFDLTILPTSRFGRFAALTMVRHLSSPSSCFDDWSGDRVEYEVPTESFHFIKDPRL